MTLAPRLVLAVSLLVFAAAPVAAQSEREPDRAVFGGGVGNAEQVLSVNSNVGTTYFRSLSGRPPGPGGEQLPDSAWFGQGSAFMDYRLDWKALSARAAAGVFSYYLPSQDRWTRQPVSNARAGFSHEWQLSSRTQLSVRQALSFQPGYYGAFPSGYQPRFDATDPALYLPQDLADFRGHLLTSQSGASFSHDLSRRVSLGTNYNFDRRWSFGRPEDFDLLQQSVAAFVGVEVTRNLSVRGGYRIYDVRLGPPGSPSVRTQSVDIGISYNRGGSLQLTRQTTLSFNVGAAAVADTARRQHYLLLGGATLEHEMGRTWTSSIQYQRSIDYASLFEEPILSDTVTARMGGLVGPRLAFESSAAYSSGTVGFGGPGNGLARAAGLVGLQSALTRYLAVGVNYTYYYRSIESQVRVPSDLSRQSRSQAVRVYLSTWMPLFARVRRSDATR